jgi:hypothetical protein
MLKRCIGHSWLYKCRCVYTVTNRALVTMILLHMYSGISWYSKVYKHFLSFFILARINTIIYVLKWSTRRPSTVYSPKVDKHRAALTSIERYLWTSKMGTKTKRKCIVSRKREMRRSHFLRQASKCDGLESVSYLSIHSINSAVSILSHPLRTVGGRNTIDPPPHTSGRMYVALCSHTWSQCCVRSTISFGTKAHRSPRWSHMNGSCKSSIDVCIKPRWANFIFLLNS